MFDIKLYHDGIPSKYGNATSLDLEEAVEELIYYNDFSTRYDEEELEEMLSKMETGLEHSKYFDFGLTQYRIIKTK